MSEELQPTPRKVERYWNKLPDLFTSQHVILASDYDALERELARVTAERDALKADRETELFQMAGYLSAELPALHSVEGGEIIRAVDSWIKREAKDSELARND